MAKGLTPLIGLAVVVALAMVAVFGAMSLTPSPAQAQTLTEMDICSDQGFIPNQGVALNEMELYSVGKCFHDTDDIDATGVRSSDETVATAVLQMTEADPPVATGDIIVSGKKLGTSTIEVSSATGSKSFTLTVYNTGPMTKGTIPDQSLGPITDVAGAEDPSQNRTVDASMYFTGSDLMYAASSNDDSVMVATTNADVEVTSGSGNAVGESATITVTATNPVDKTGVKQTFMVYIDGPPELLVTDADAALDTADRDPGVQVKLPDLREGATRTVDASDYFSGDRNVYAVSSGNANFVTAKIEEDSSNLILTGKSRGTPTKVKLTATSGGGAVIVELIVQVTRTAAAEQPALDTRDTAPIDSMITVEGAPNPGKVDRIELMFDLPEETNTLVHDMVIDMEDFVFPSSVGTSSVVVSATGFAGISKNGIYTFTPEDVDVDGTNLVLSLGDVTEDTSGGKEQGGVYEIPAGSDITVVIRSTADIATPTEAGGYPVTITFGGNEIEDFAEVMIDRVVNLADASSGDGGLEAGRGDVATVSGKGYKNGTTVTFWRDNLVPVMWDDDNKDATAMVLLKESDKAKYEMAVDPMMEHGDIMRSSLSYSFDNKYYLFPLPQEPNTMKYDGMDILMSPNGMRDPDEEILCAAVADDNDVATCEFEVNNPPFIGGGQSNYINGVDGRGQRAATVGHFKQRLLLTPSITVTPSGGSPGEVMLVQLLDFPSGQSVDQVQLSRTDICGGIATNANGTSKVCSGSTDSQGNVNVSVVIPNWAVPGKQELKVITSGGSDNLTVDITGPRIQATPKEVVANQRVSLVGSGFFAGSKIGDCDSCNDAAITIGGDPIPWQQINGGDDVDVDNGGNWSAAVDLPLTSATTANGERTIRVTDSMGRTGTVDVTILARRVEITPSSGRVGTQSVVRGWNFPSKNDDGESFNVVIRYDAGNQKGATVTAVPDASGRFETPLRIPTTAGIPSTNTVTVEFDDVNDVTVVTTVTHDVPEGIIKLSSTSGSPGSEITISGEGFKTFVPVQSVKVGNIEVTPSPNPSTDGQGMLGFNVTIPGLDNGIQTIEVKVSGTTASVGFTVRPSGVSAGDITASAEATVNLGENFVRSFNFNNDTKSWTFYSPEAPDDSTQTSFITGESYWILIGESQEVILNGKTRNLTCEAGNCWNQLVW